MYPTPLAERLTFHFFPRRRYEQDVAAARVALGEAAFSAAWAAGWALTPEEAVAPT